MERRQHAGGVGRTSLIPTTNVSASSEEARENHSTKTVVQTLETVKAA